MAACERLACIKRSSGIGRPPKDRVAMARAFAARAVWNLPTTSALPDRLRVDKSRRRMCGRVFSGEGPSEATSWRAFAEFAASRLPAVGHETMVKQAYDGHLVGHVSRDATATEGREKAKPRAAGRRRQRDGSLPDRQGRQSLEEMLAALPYNCDVGRKKGSKGHCMTWCGDKLHLDVADGGVPLSCILTLASRHDSQVAMLTGERVAHLYALMDSAYDAKAIKAFCEASGQVAIIRTSARRNKRLKEDLAREATAQRHASQIDPASLRYRLRVSGQTGTS